MNEKEMNWKEKERKKENRRELETREPIQRDEDFVYLDGAFCAYLIDQTSCIRTKAEMIELLVDKFEERTTKIPMGMLPNKELINECSRTLNHLEKVHTLLAIELMRLKSMQLAHKAWQIEENKGNSPDPDVSVG